MIGSFLLKRAWKFVDGSWLRDVMEVCGDTTDSEKGKHALPKNESFKTLKLPVFLRNIFTYLGLRCTHLVLWEGSISQSMF